MKLRDTDYLYATMTIRANEKKLLTQALVERMVEAKSFEDAAKVLVDAGYGKTIARDFRDVENAVNEALLDTITTVSEATGNDHIKNVFLLKYDFHNIKVLLKASFSQKDFSYLLSDVSTIPKDKLVSALLEDNLSELPGRMAEAVENAREVLSKTRNAELSDTILDIACFEMMMESAKASESSFLAGYVELLSSAFNLRLFARCKRRDDEGYESKKLPFEIFDKSILEKAYELSEKVAQGAADFWELEREIDIAVLKYMSAAKYAAFDEKPVVAYLALRDIDAIMVRIIMTGKLLGHSPEQIRRRLRVAD